LSNCRQERESFKVSTIGICLKDMLRKKNEIISRVENSVKEALKSTGLNANDHINKEALNESSLRIIFKDILDCFYFYDA
jgi:hypothetical protein